MKQKLCIHCKKVKPIIDFGSFKTSGQIKLSCKTCAAKKAASQLKHRQARSQNHVSERNVAWGKRCSHCGIKKKHSEFSTKTNGKRETACNTCIPKIQEARKKWAKLALFPVNGDRYHSSVAISIDEYVERKKSDVFVECDYGNGIGVRGRA